MEQLKSISRLETANIKAKLSSVRYGAERAENERYKVANIKRQLDEMRADMIDKNRLEMWAKDIEGIITPVFSILDDRMSKLEIGGEIIAGGK